MEDIRIKYTFSGHESFQCRQLWLKKGFDFIKSGSSFNSEDAVVQLGVGKNMVSSIRFWLKAFNITDKNDNLTSFGNKLLSDDGWDPFLEDENSIWLLHYNLVKNNFASTYNLIFNNFRFEKIRFHRESYYNFVKRKIDETNGYAISEKTISEDFNVFLKLYLNNSINLKEIEDSYAGILSDLNIIHNYGSKKQEQYGIENDLRENLDESILLYAILEQEEFGESVNLNYLESGFNSLGAIFCINRTGIQNKIDQLVNKYNYITYQNQAGIREIQFKEKPLSTSILDGYYDK